VNGALDDRAKDLMARFPDLYWEPSLSGTGLHGIGYGELPTATSGKHPDGIGIFHHSRYFVMMGDPLPGYEIMGSYGDGLLPWYLEHFEKPTQTTSAAPVSLTLNDRDLMARLRSEKNGTGIAGPLLDGDNSGYPDFSSARFALASKVCFYSDDAEQIARILRSSDLFNPKDNDRERDRKALQDARKAVNEYTGPRYAPTYNAGPRLIAPLAAPAELAQMSVEDKDATIRRLEAQLQDAHSTIIVLRERVRQADEREAIYKNTKLGAARQTAAALVSIFQEERPRDPDSLHGFRVPLAKMAERTGLSPDACSRHMKKLSEYTTDDGAPVFHVETRDIPRTVDHTTGEIIEPHKEIWAGPGVDPTDFGRVLATLAPAAAPKHGGAPDRNVCPDHPHAGTIRRSKTIRRITRECAHCHKGLSSEDVEVGKEESQYIRPMPHDAFPPASVGNDPTRHDAFANADPGDPIQQHAASIDTHIALDLSSNMQGRYHDRDRLAEFYRGEAVS
jgi:cell pole-organizing protein PopZ